MLSKVSRTVRSSHQTRGAWRSASSLSAAKQRWNGRLVLAPEVEHALEKGAPVIALESTIITHGKSSFTPLPLPNHCAQRTGMPHPTNLTTAQSLESIIRSHHVTPATIALIDGKVHVGLSSAQLEQLADPTYTGPGKVKASRRDLAGTLSKKLIGGTTVASTMYVAQSVGVDVFVTGGIGGAHRGSQDSMDISADLIELGRTPMAVVCAGAKSILDIPRTLEVLETQGVCVASYGDSHDFPAFYSPSSGQKSPWNVANPKEAASLIHAGLTLPHPLATLLAVPIPAEYAARGEQVQQAVEQAVRESIEQGIDKRGKEVTPWLLKRVGELTQGTALELKNNARVGSAVALELARFKQEAALSSPSSSGFGPNSGSNASNAAYSHFQPTPSPLVSEHTSTSSQHAHSSPPTPLPDLPPPKVLVFGSAAIDITSRTPHALAPRSTTPGEIDLTPGGVGRNIAEAAQRGLGKGEVRLISPVGASLLVARHDEVGARGNAGGEGEGKGKGVEVDTVGRVIMAEMAEVGMRTDGLIVKTQTQPEGVADNNGQQIRSSACTLVLGKDGDLEAGVADMGIVERVTVEEVEAAIKAGQEHARMIVHDCNPTPEAIRAILQGAYEAGIPSFCDPTSTPKLQRLIPALRSILPSDPALPRPLTHISPNTLELDVLHALLSSTSDSSTPAESNADSTWAYINSLNLTADFRARVDAFVRSGRGTLDWLSQEGVIQKATSLLPWFSSIWIKSGSRGVVRVAILPSAEAGSSSSGSSSTATIISPTHTATSMSTSAGSTGGKRLVYPLDPSGTGAGPHVGKSLIIAHYPAPTIREDEIVSTTGAGDSLVGGLVAGLVKGLEEAEMVGEALDRVGKSLRSRRAVA